MLSIWKMVFISIAYYLGLVAENYYLSGGEPPGRWGGGGARALGLIGIVTRKMLRALFRGVHPTTGLPLVQNAERVNRCPGHDFTFNPPKDLSIIATLPKVYQEVRDIQEASVRSALNFGETNFAYTRVGSVRKGKWHFKPVRLVAALFEHFTSRLGDMHLHTHALLANLGVDENGDTRALYSRPLFKARDLLGAYYRAQLAYLLHKELGLVCVRKGDSFQIRGVPRRLVRFWSKRRKEIEEEMKRNGKSGGKAAAKAALKTRRTKKDIPPRAKLLKRWRRMNAVRGFGSWSLPGMQDWTERDPKRDLPRALAQAVANLSRRGSHFSERDFLKETLCEAVNYAIPPDLISTAVHEHLKTDETIIPLREVKGEKRYATQEIIQRERQLLDNMDALLDRRGPRANPQLVERILSKRPKTNEEQAQAVRHLTLGRGSIRIVDGLAGVGKTSYVIQPCLEIWKKQGYRVVGAAPTGAAAHVLEQTTGIPTDTIHMRLCDFDRRFGFVARHHVKQYWRVLRGKRAYRLKRHKPIKVGSKDILVVDESGMVNTRHMRMLTERVRKGGGTLVLLGDAAQIPPVEGGAPFQSLCARAASTSIRKVLRQKEEWARKAVEHFSRGEAGEALKLFADRGLITVRDDMNDALESLVDDWAELGIRTPEKCAVLVATNEQSETANKLCQQRRIDAGQLDPSHRIRVYDDQESGDEPFKNVVHIGDQILFTRNDRRLNVRNGFVGKVTAIRKLLRSIAVQLDDGRTVVIPVHKYRHLRLGYSETTCKIQGSGRLHISVLATGQNQQPISYVQGSRAILTTRFYTTKYLLDLKDIENSPLVNQMARKPDLRLAVDLLDSDESECGNQEASEQQTAVPSEQLHTNVTVPTAANTDATLRPPASRRQDSARSNGRDKREKRRLAAAALRRRQIEQHRRQQHAYAAAQAEWERQRREYEIAQANLLASLSKYAKKTRLQTLPVVLGEDFLSHYVERLTHDVAESQTQPTMSILASPFADLFDEPSPQELPDFEPVKTPEPFLLDTPGNCDRQESADSDSSPRPVEQPTETYTPYSTRRDDDYDPWESYRSRCVAEQVGQRPTSSWGSTDSTYQSSYGATSSAYSTYNQANQSYSAYQTYGAAQTSATQQQTQTRIVPGSGPG